jgi:two-component system chemotaxis sensor kinase CheA
MSDYLDPNNEELLQDFFAEAQTQVELLESNILVLENDPSQRDPVDEIFRAAHTLKGASATVQMNELSEFTHVLEDVLDQIRESSVAVTPELVDRILAAVDMIKEMLAARERGEVYEKDHSAITDSLRELVSGTGGKTTRKRTKKTQTGTPKKKKTAKPAEPVEEPDSVETPDDEADTEERRPTEEPLAPGESLVAVHVRFDQNNPMNTVGGIQVYAALKRIGTVRESDPDFDALYSDEFHPVVTYRVATTEPLKVVETTAIIPEVTTEVRVARVASAPADQVAAEEAVAVDEEEAAGEASVKRRSTPSSSVLRVDSRRVDNLLNLVSETVINKAAFNQISSEFAEGMLLLQNSYEEYKGTLRDLMEALPEYLEKMQNGASVKQIKREVGDRFGSLYSAFDQYIGEQRHTVSKFRSTGQNLGRITGELQEGVMRIRMVPISQIFSRFPRLVRDLTRSLNKKVNLVIEGEDTELDKSVIEDLLDPLIHCVRNSIDHGVEAPADRAEAGKPDEGQLILRASSEGNMIVIEVSDDGQGIDVAGIQQRAIERGLIHPSKVLSDVEAFNLIFEPGFSTAEKVSSISGRGVGLDVVRKQIEKLNGSVSVASSRGEGAKFTIKIPLTLAIIQGLIVRVGTETYAIPITAVLESHRIKPDEIRMLDNYEVLNVREDVVSLLRLSRIFRVDTSEQRTYYYVVIVGSGEKKVGLIVDALVGEEDVVIKPLRDRFTNAPGIAGANITGDGTVSLIIDVAQLLELGLQHERDKRKRREAVIGRGL